MAAPLLEIRRLGVSVKQRRNVMKAVDDLTLDVHPGEILGLVGESGAGKSMTGAAILGLLEPPLYISGGEIHFEGQRIDPMAGTLRGAKISMVFQDPLVSLNPLRTVGEQLVEAVRAHIDMSRDAALERARALLTDVGIDPGRVNAYPHTFSGGMRQRVVTALALAPEPSLIIADEPTTALDVSVQAQILDLLKRLCGERKTSIILITHDMGVIAETTDRVAVMYSGRLVEIGRTKDVLNKPRHPYTQGLVAATPRIDADSFNHKLFQIPGAMPDLDNIPEGCAFHPRCGSAFGKCREQRPELLEGRAACWLLENGGGKP